MNTPPPELINRKKTRDSRFELLRILCMYLIISHHFVESSAVRSHFNDADLSGQMIFLKTWMMWGKTAINSFILISGYFLCTSSLSWKRIVKLYAQIKFYRWMILTIFVTTGYCTLSIGEIKGALFELLENVNMGFTASFMAFYIFVPFYNIVIRNISKRQHALLILGLLLYFTFASTFVNAYKSMNEPFWYMTLYFIAAYIRLYPNRLTENRGFSIICLCVGVLCCLCITVGTLIIERCDMGGLSNIAEKFTLYFVVDSNKIGALWVGLFLFLTAKNSRPFHSELVNKLASCCFGVLLIHASSGTMRHWLWNDVVETERLLSAPIAHTIIVSIITPMIIYLACSVIDLVRQTWLERPFMNWVYKNSERIEKTCKRGVAKVASIL